MSCFDTLDSSITFLGVRGSLPVSGSEFLVYGGATSCALVRMGGQTILLDAGTGLMSAEPFLPEGGKAYILLTHAHLDHMLGLLCFSPLYNSSREFDIMSFADCGFDIHSQIGAMMRTPIWPVATSSFSPAVKLKTVGGSSMSIGDVAVDIMSGNHPGGCAVIKLTCGGESVVYCTDFEYDEHAAKRLSQFAKGASIIILDGQYSDEEYPAKRGWGHSSWSQCVKMAKMCKTNRLVITHHDPARTDEQLKDAQLSLRGSGLEVSFAKAGERIMLNTKH